MFSWEDRIGSKTWEKVAKFIKENDLNKYIYRKKKFISSFEMKELYKKADISVNVSKDIVLPSFSSMEAMASWIPLVVTNEIDVEKYVTNWESWFIVKANHEEIADKLIDLITNKEKRISFWKKAQENIIKNFQIKDRAKRYWELYNKLI